VTPVAPTVPVVVPPTTGKSGKYLNPGMIETVPFYNTTNDVQSKFYWGTGRPLQTGDTFNAESWNTIPNAPKTAWGIQELAQPGTFQSALNILQGQPSYPQLSPAEQSYLSILDPQARAAFLRSKGLG
jgi:hypothetical protein